MLDKIVLRLHVKFFQSKAHTPTTLLTCAPLSPPLSVCPPLPLPLQQDGDDDDEDWAEETTEEAQRRRMEEISEHAKGLTLSDDLEKTLEERVNMFYNFVKVRPWGSRVKPVTEIVGFQHNTDLSHSCEWSCSLDCDWPSLTKSVANGSSKTRRTVVTG